ncbi:MAG: rhodanese-like domain-containing protein [Planctomycetota bacterium]|nr:rhodanese-like domain-containing protein [Planctomycetota bacterium]
MTITSEMTMEVILDAFPSARRALFQRYHIGGCTSCAYELSDTLAEVCKNKNILDVNEVVEHMYLSEELDTKLQIEADEVKGWIAEGRDFTFMDVRTDEERGANVLAEAEVLEFARSSEYLAMDKERLFVFADDNGGKALDVASYFVGHGFTDIRVLRGGTAAW